MDTEASATARDDVGRPPPRPVGPIRRLLWIVAGLLCVGIGAIGIIVPGLPTTIFFILAAGAFAKGSPRLEAWVLSLPKIGPMVRDHRAGLGMPRTAKRAAIVTVVVFVGLSAWLIDSWTIRLIVIGLGAVGIAVIAKQPTRVEPAD